MLEDYPDVFADIMNVFLFHGEQVVREEELQETDVLSQYKADTTRLHQQERDILKLWVRKDKTVYLEWKIRQHLMQICLCGSSITMGHLIENSC